MNFNSFESGKSFENAPQKEETSLSHVEQLKLKIGPEYFPDDEEIKFTRKAAKKVVKNILEENNGKLPDFIVYPETSARVLPYLFNPVFRKIAEREKIKPPFSYFISIIGTHDDEDIKRVALETERANEILRNADLQGFNCEIINFIDDTLIDGRARSSLKRAFKERVLCSHFLFGSHDAFFGKQNADVGHSFTEKERPKPGKPVGVFWRLPDEDKFRDVGVVKSPEDKYVQVYPDSTYKNKKYLRDILSAIGEDIFFDLKEDERIQKEVDEFLKSYELR